MKCPSRYIKDILQIYVHVYFNFYILQLILRVPTVVVKLEGGVGKRTVPLLIVETAFQGEVKNWSSKVIFKEKEILYIL